MFQDLNWTTFVGGTVYLGVVAALGYAAVAQGNHDAMTALIAIVSPASGAAAAVTFLRPRVVMPAGPTEPPTA